MRITCINKGNKINEDYALINILLSKKVEKNINKARVHMIFFRLISNVFNQK